jgi:hypothetical protein
VYFQYVLFYSARTTKSFVSSAKWEMVNGELNKVSGNCLGYDEWRREIDEGIERNHRTVSMRLMHAFNGIHLDFYHTVPALDAEGRALVYAHGNKKGEQILRQEQCDGRKCEYCKEKIPKTFGKKVHWSIGLGHLQQLGGIIDDIAKDCAGCGGSGTVETLSHDCEQCGKIVVDTSDFDLTNEVQSSNYFKITGNLYECSCGYVGPLMPQYECGSCKDPEPLAIFDCDIDIKKQGEGAQTTIQVPRWTRTELSDELKDMTTPYPFADIFSADPLDIQAKFLGVRNTYAGGAEEHSREYGKSNYSK